MPATRQYRFSVLLGLLVLMLVSAPVTPYFLRHVSRGSAHLVSSIVVTGFFCLVVVASAVAVQPSERMKWLVRGLAATSVLLQAISPAVETMFVSAASHLIAIVFLGIAVTLIVRRLFEQQLVTGELLCASLCAYVLLGIVWAVAYSLLELMLPGSFTLTNQPGTGEWAMLFGAEHSSLPLYYSFITLTTLGYGDVLPATPFSQMLASVEALTGQVYLAVLVARMVGLHIAQATSDS